MLPEKKTPYLKKWMAQTDPPKEASTLERMDFCQQLLSLNKIAM